jgi:acetylornithine deacetylase/succinyl-diaminopimelate desuccinylase-like protein
VSDDPTGEVTDLLQHLIRNACVNDGTPESGQEARSVELLESYLEGRGLDLETFEPLPGRASLVARIEGRDPSAPTLMLMGHTDVVPANPEGWRRDPFGGELVDGEAGGRGATDMLNLTASMAVAIRHLADAGFRPRGTLVYLAVADEEALGDHGVRYLLGQHRDAVAADYVLTEGGGMQITTPRGPKILSSAGEKGTYWCKLRVRGTPSHASRPLRTDNAVLKAAELARRIAAYRPETRITEVWRRYVERMELEPEVAEALVDPARVWETCEELPGLALARLAHACTHTTFAPTVVRGGSKVNVIPDEVELDVDIRTLPGQRAEDVEAMLAEIVGDDLRPSVEIRTESSQQATVSPIDTPLWDAMQRWVARLRPEASLVPALAAGASDARFFRQAGVTAYGFGLMSGRIPADELVTMFHGENERIDQASLRLTAELWEGLVAEFLG